VPVALQIKDFKVRSLDLDFHELSWKLAETSVDVLDYTFQVLRSESPSGPFEPQGAPFEDKYIFIDTQLQVAHRWRKYFYKIQVTLKRTGEQIETEPVALEPDADLVAVEIRRHMQLLMQEFAGRMCWVLPVRTFGQRCSCWDRMRQAVSKSGCRTCYTTGFVRGYLSPIETWMQIDPSPKTQQTAQTGATQQVNATARLGHFPPVKPGDLIIEAENRRWRVVQQNQTEKSRATLHQEIAIHEIPRRDIEFDIPLILDGALRDLFISPSRNFSNPQNLQNFEDEVMPNIFALYNTNPRNPSR
jgi:hypothetical protein